jgi:hypothetical protein
MEDNKILANENAFQDMNTRMTAAAAKLLPTDFPDDLVMNIYCECANKACRERLRIDFGEYSKLTNKINAYVVKPEHVLFEFERVETQKDDYWLIIKKTDKLKKRFEL